MDEPGPLPGLVLFGAGGHGKVVADVAERQGRYRLEAFLDDADVGAEFYGVPVLRGADPAALLAEGRASAAFVSIGSNPTRRRVQQQLAALGYELATLVHPGAQVARGAVIGAGSVVMPGCVLGPDCVLGEGVIVNTGATVDHDCVLGDYAQIGPGAHLGGDVRVGAAAMIGLGAAVRQGRSVGAGAMVAMGAAVTADVPDRTLTAGVPARPLREVDPDVFRI